MSDKRRILVIDDDVVVSTVIGKIAEQQGAEVTTARDGRAAHNALAQIEQFDAVFLDLLMPHASGWDILNSIKSMEGGAEIPVVVVSGAPISGEEKKALLQKATAFVCKETFRLNDFRKLMQDILAGHKIVVVT